MRKCGSKWAKAKRITRFPYGTGGSDPTRYKMSLFSRVPYDSRELHEDQAILATMGATCTTNMGTR